MWPKIRVAEWSWVDPRKEEEEEIAALGFTRASAQTPAQGHSPGASRGGNSKACTCLQSSALGVAVL